MLNLLIFIKAINEVNNEKSPFHSNDHPYRSIMRAC